MEFYEVKNITSPQTLPGKTEKKTIMFKTPLRPLSSALCKKSNCIKNHTKKPMLLITL